MEKLLYKGSCMTMINVYDEIQVRQICGWIFLGMVFSENINGRIFYRPSIALTFSSNACIIPDRLLPSRACFRLYRCDKNNEKCLIIKNNSKNKQKNLFVNKNISIFVNLKSD